MDKSIEQYIKIIEKLRFFEGLNRDEITNTLKCLDAKIKHYEKDEFILSEGDIVTNVGIVLTGQAHSQKIDISGKTVIVTVQEQGSYIGILLAARQRKISPVSVQATEPVTVLFFPAERIIGVCKNACSCHIRVLSNFIDGIAEKALHLHDRNDCLIKSTVREKILTFLETTSREKKSRSFSIPMDRAAMAQYLNVERSALSRELGRMKRDGIIDFYKNSFKIV